MKSYMKDLDKNERNFCQMEQIFNFLRPISLAKIYWQRIKKSHSEVSRSLPIRPKIRQVWHPSAKWD